jgi:hypothetical protein
MAHVIPTLRTTSRTVYTPPAVRRNSNVLAADFRTLLKNQSGPTLTVSSGQPGASSTTRPTSPALSGSFLRNQTPSDARSGVASAGSEAAAPTAAPSQPKILQAAAPTQAAAASAPAPSYFPGTNIPTQNPFGPDPYIPNPTQNIFAGNGSGQMVQQSLAPYYYPTQQTAQTAAQLFGGTVIVQTPDAVSPFTINQPTYMVRLPNGTEINPGIISHFYDTRSDTPAQLQQLVQDVLNGGTMATLQPNPLAHATT